MEKGPGKKETRERSIQQRSSALGSYPFSPLLMNFWTSFTPRRICLCFDAANQTRDFFLAQTETAPARSPPTPPRPHLRRFHSPSRLSGSASNAPTFLDAFVKLARQLAGGQRLRDRVHVFQEFLVRPFRGRLDL